MANSSTETRTLCCEPTRLTTSSNTMSISGSVPCAPWMKPERQRSRQLSWTTLWDKFPFNIEKFKVFLFLSFFVVAQLCRSRVSSVLVVFRKARRNSHSLWRCGFWIQPRQAQRVQAQAAPHQRLMKRSFFSIGAKLKTKRSSQHSCDGSSDCKLVPEQRRRVCAGSGSQARAVARIQMQRTRKIQSCCSHAGHGR